MHVEATRLLTRWLKGEQEGVNALLQTIPRMRLTGKPDPKPPRVEVFNDVDFDIMKTSGIQPPSMPCLVVVVDLNPKTADLKQINASGHVMSAAAGIGFYADQTTVNESVVLGNYTLRAVKQSLTRFNRAPQPQREINKVLISVTGIEIQRVASAVPESYMLGVLFADLMILDKAP